MLTQPSLILMLIQFYKSSMGGKIINATEHFVFIHLLITGYSIYVGLSLS